MCPYELLTAWEFMGMKDALCIVLSDKRCIIYNMRVSILFTLTMLESHSFPVMEWWSPFSSVGKWLVKSSGAEGSGCTEVGVVCRKQYDPFVANTKALFSGSQALVRC